MLLERALPSVLGQTYRDFNIHIVCHGCTDRTFERITLFGPFDKRIKLHNIPRTRMYPPTAENHWLMGPTEALNYALENAITGEFIARIDDDDIWSKDHLESMVELLNGENLEFVSSGHTANGKPVAPYTMTDGTKIGGCQTWVYRSYLSFFRYNKDSWRKNWNRNNDTDMQDRMWRAGVRMGYLDVPTVAVEPRPGETSVGSIAYLTNPGKIEEKYSFGN